MIDCKEYLEGGKYEGLYEGTTKMILIESLSVKHSTTFLCPHGLDRLVVQGHYGAEAFRYVTMTVDGCDLGPEECMPDEEIIREPLNFYQLRANPSLSDTLSGKDIVYTADVTFIKFINPTMR